MRRGTITATLSYFDENIDMMLITIELSDFLQDLEEYGINSHKICYTRKDANRLIASIENKLLNYNGRYAKDIDRAVARIEELKNYFKR